MAVFDKDTIQGKSFIFGVEIIKYCKLLNARKHYDISRQLLRCGTSIGANIQEAQAAQSRRDFLSKMSISSKEAREARYFLLLIQESELAEDVTQETQKLLHKVTELVKILTKITRTTSDNLKEIKN